MEFETQLKVGRVVIVAVAHNTLLGSELNTRSSCIFGVMRNVTITLDEKTVAWARVHAARRSMSLSRFLGEILHERMSESREYEQAMRRFLAIKPRNLSDGNPYPTRAEVNDRKDLR